MTDIVSAPDAPRWWLVPQRLFDGREWRPDTALLVEDGRIAALAPPSTIPAGATVVRSQHLASPGLVDLQINGGGGALFNNDPCVETLRIIGQAHRKLGTTAWLATFITDTPDRLDQAVDAVIACAGRFGVAGMHIEGPHINPARKGTHAAALIRPFDDRTLASLARLRRADVPTLLTVAPETLPPGTVAALVAMGVVVSTGHSAATAVQIEAALAEGLSCFTHLHNAMTPMTAREPGVVGAALDSEAWYGLIADGLHVGDTMLRLSLRARRRRDRCFLVSDAMATVGGPDSFVLYGATIGLRDGMLVNAEGALAGAHLDMASAVRRIVREIGLSPQEALAMATSIPAEAMGLDTHIGTFALGARADILLLDEALDVVAVLAA